MTSEQLKAFAAIVNYGTIASAADHLFASQSTVSFQIKQLEKELGVTLFDRHQGRKKTCLTEEGKVFLPICLHILSLYDKAGKIHEVSFNQQLTIASIDIVNNHALVPFFGQFLDGDSPFKLTIKTHHSNEIHGLVANRMADIGYVFSQDRYPNLTSKPIYRELMYVVYHKDSDYPNIIDPIHLDASQEIYLRWADDYELWHHRFWRDEEPLMTVNTGSMLKHYLTEPNRWAIAPMSVIQSMMSDCQIRYSSLTSPPPPRICYQLTRQDNTQEENRLINKFERLLADFVACNNHICSFRSWMLSE